MFLNLTLPSIVINVYPRHPALCSNTCTAPFPGPVDYGALMLSGLCTDKPLIPLSVAERHFFCTECSKRERVEVFVSDLALLLVTSGLYKLGTTFGWTWLLCTYGIPYLVVNHFLVRTAFLKPASIQRSSSLPRCVHQSSVTIVTCSNRTVRCAPVGCTCDTAVHFLPRARCLSYLCTLCSETRAPQRLACIPCSCCAGDDHAAAAHAPVAAAL